MKGTTERSNDRANGDGNGTLKETSMDEAAQWVQFHGGERGVARAVLDSRRPAGDDALVLAELGAPLGTMALLAQALYDRETKGLNPLLIFWEDCKRVRSPGEVTAPPASAANTAEFPLPLELVIRSPGMEE